MGPDHAKIQISELKITLRKYGKEFYAKEQARTKKCGNALVCWSIVKQLFKDSVQNILLKKARTGQSGAFLNVYNFWQFILYFEHNIRLKW